jgi:hypothetical protein
VRSRSLFLLLFPAVLLAGCHRHPQSITQLEQKKAEQQALANAQRSQVEQIPPPSKNRYMNIHTFDEWQNPYITVQPGMLEIHILQADATPGVFGSGGMLRPAGARRQVVMIAFEKLGEAVSSIPQNAWPYGRVVAIEEAHHTPKTAEPLVRRNMEQAIATLNDLGIEVYDINEGRLQ